MEDERVKSEDEMQSVGQRANRPGMASDTGTEPETPSFLSFFFFFFFFEILRPHVEVPRQGV